MIKHQEKYPGRMIEISEKIAQEKTVTMPDNGPIRLLFISDLHMFDPDSSREYINQVLEELSKPNTYAVLLGDIIQGFNPTRASMAAGTPRLDEQMLTAEAILKPFADQGKIIAAVGGTDSHEGWADKNMTFDATYFMFRNLKGVDGQDLPIMNNGGYVTLQFPNGGQHRIRVYHDAGGGGSAKNMVGSERSRAMEITVDDPLCPDQVVGGHTHSRAMITTELAINVATGEVISQTFAAGGTAQGIDPNRPNVFLTARGVAPSLPGLPATILTPHPGDGTTRRDVWGLENSGKLLEAVRLWEAIESRNLGTEIEAMIRENIPTTQAEFQSDISRPVVRTSADQDIKNQVYEVAKWRVRSNVPLLTVFLGGTRYGSSSTDESAARKVVAEAANNPEAFLIITRRMVDKGLSSDPDRDAHLSDMVDLIEPAGRNGKILALLMDDKGLRDPGWKKPIGDYESGDGSSPVVTGDYIQSRLPVPLIYNGSFVVLDVGGVAYRYYIRDKLGNNGSSINPFAGLEVQVARTRTSVDVAAGGHMPRVGVSQTASRVVVAPGGYARWSEMGKGNEEPLPEGGQAVIIYPGEKRMIACATFVEARDTHRAVFYAAGLHFLPTRTQAKLLKMARQNIS